MTAGGQNRTLASYLSLFAIIGFGLTACNPLALLSAPNRQIIVEADAEQLANRANGTAPSDKLMEESAAVIDKRASEISATEPVVTRRGQNQIIVQLSADQSGYQIKNLLLAAGRLEIKLVDDAASPEDLAAGKPRVGSQILPFADGAGNGLSQIAVRRLGGLSGNDVNSAQQSFDSQAGDPIVVIQLTETGGKKFAKLTGENVGRMLAIIYDGKVISAPVINEPILGGSIQIAGGFTVESASQLAIILRTGHLPVKFRVIEDKAIK
jgi:preprotein translocase subunit SecD